MPSRPGVAAIVRMEVDDAGPLASSLEAGLDLSAAIGLPLVRLAVRSPEYRALSMGKPFQCLYNAWVERHAARFTVLGGEKLDLSSREIDLLPFEIDGFRNASARVEKEDDERMQVRGTRAD
jgi:hypothetical protein